MRGARQPSLLPLAFTLALLAFPLTTAFAGTYLLSPSAIANSLDSIVHPLGYNGTGGTLTIDVCVDPSSPSADLFPGPLGRAVVTWNALQPTTGTYVPPGQSTEVPADTWDVESVLLHELGHCANALQHDNLGSSVLFFFESATFSTMGPDNEFSFVFIGADNTWGTPDDDRGDDENFFWFRKDLNDPFFIDSFPPPPVFSEAMVVDAADHVPGNRERVRASRTTVASSSRSSPRGSSAARTRASSPRSSSPASTRLPSPRPTGGKWSAALLPLPR